MAERKSLLWVIISRVTGFMFFLAAVFALNILKDRIDNHTFRLIVDFINDNFALIVIMTIIFFFTEISSVLIFPLNLPAPIIGAIGSIFLVTFVFNILEFVDFLIDFDFFHLIERFTNIIYTVVFIITIVGGYLSILFKPFAAAEKTREKPEEKETEKKKDKTWEDIGKEIKNALYDSFHSMRESAKKDKK